MATDAALLDGNGLNPNGWNLNGLNWNGLNWNGLNWNGLHTVGLYSTGGSNTVTSNIQSWLNGQKSASGEYTALATMPYLVGCAVPSGTSVSATVNGTAYTWPGRFGLAPGWKDGDPMSDSEQQWVSACLLAHVNLLGAHVSVSFRGAHPNLATTPAEVASHNCREGAFMGNVFAGHATEALPMMQCHEPGGPSGSGRSCDPAMGSYSCASDCSATCNKAGDYFTACDTTINGTPTSYANIITTYLPADPAKGCLGWGLDYTSNSATYTSSGSSSRWSWGWSWSSSSNSCSWHCGGYTQAGTSCAPGCAAAGNCAVDYAAICGAPPPYSGPTSGVSTCPSGYTSYTGTLSSSHTEDYFPSSSGYTAAAAGTHHGTLLGPGTAGTGANYNLQIQRWDPASSAWKTDAYSERNTANESIHFFYGVASRIYRWRVSRSSGTGTYKFCLKNP